MALLVQPVGGGFAGGLSRREFLAASAAGGLSLLTQQSQPAASAPDATTWALLADTHTSSDLGKTVRGSHMANNLRRVVRQVRAYAPQRLLFNGDVAYKNGPTADYEAFLKLIEPLQNGKAKAYFTLGNHDDRDSLVAAIGGEARPALESKWVTSVRDAGVRWVFLDSLHRVNHVSGTLGPQQLDWLKKLLDAEQRMPTVVCLHHNPEKTLIGLTDADALLELLKPRRKVKAVMFGHTHVYRRWTVDGLHLINLPAVGYPFNPFQPLGWVQARVSSKRMELTLRNLKDDKAPEETSEVLEWRSDV
jgi:3',5'-cyclic AMP phosphodiesterase CpdA